MLKKLFRTGAFVNGKFLQGKTYELRSPSSGELLANVQDSDDKLAYEAIQASQDAFQVWKNSSVATRSQALKNLHSLVKSNARELASIITAENGKPLPEALGEVEYGALFIEWFAEEVKRPSGEVLSCQDSRKTQHYYRQPVGVCALITPWNFPIAMVTRKIAPAIAAGCTVVLKPAPETPLTALAFAQLVNDAGIPPGVVNILPASKQNSPEIGDAFCSSPIVKKLSFTGSTAVGLMLNEKAARTLKRVSLELGGNAPCVVFADFFDRDEYLGHVADQIMAAKFRCAGQTCVSPQRFLVHDSIAEDLVAMLKERVSKLNVGDGFEEGVRVGPLISKEGRDKVHRHVEDALSKGAVLHHGGKPLSSNFYQPTLISHVTQDMLVSKEETFGPLLAIQSFSTEEEAVEKANATEFGLAGYLFTRDSARIQRVSAKIEVGMLGVNTGAISHENAPFGGLKYSGIGREGHSLGLHEYQSVKYIASYKE